jgi:hypothetical protein
MGMCSNNFQRIKIMLNKRMIENISEFKCLGYWQQLSETNSKTNFYV